ncbi:alpha/beta hydrolase [Hungatella hathewayi]
MNQRVLLEPAAETVCIENSVPPLIFELPPEEGRRVLEEAQDAPVCLYPAQVEASMVDTGQWGRIPVYRVTPVNSGFAEHVIFYIHGAGWVFGSFHTHEKLVRELAARTGCTVIFPEYSRSPEARYPTAVEQCYSILCQLPDLFEQAGRRMNGNTLTVAGDSVGGNMAIAMTLFSKYRGGPVIHKQLLYYPVTNACFNTASYCEFAECYYLYRAGMMWFWDQYTTSENCRNQITASPLRACTEHLEGLPQAMILNGQADVLRDEGEAYAEKLRVAGVPVTAMRFQAIIHDFVMLNALDETNACRAAMDASTEWINRKNMEWYQDHAGQSADDCSIA